MRYLFTLYLSLFAFFASAQLEDLKKEIQQIILNDTEISLDDTPGFLIGIIDGDLTYVVNFGVDSIGSETHLSSEDIFELGSLTKVFTASLTSILVADDVIKYDDPINKYLSEKHKNPRLEKVTVLDLVQHYSSLPIRPLFFGKKNIDPTDPYAYYSKNDLLKFFNEYVPSKEELTSFRYAHTNYAMLEIILENATQKEFGQLLKEYLFDPLEMNSSFINFLEERENIVTTGYDRARRITKPWTFASFAGSEGAKSNMEDMIKYLRANMGLSNTRLDKIFAQNITSQRETDFNEVIHTGRGWQILDRRKKYDIVTHTGKTRGHNTSIAFINETKTGVIVLANSSIGTENLGLLVLRMINRNWKRKS